MCCASCARELRALRLLRELRCVRELRELHELHELRELRELCKLREFRELRPPALVRKSIELTLHKTLAQVEQRRLNVSLPIAFLDPLDERPMPPPWRPGGSSRREPSVAMPVYETAALVSVTSIT